MNLRPNCRNLKIIKLLEHLQGRQRFLRQNSENVANKRKNYKLDFIKIKIQNSAQQNISLQKVN